MGVVVAAAGVSKDDAARALEKCVDGDFRLVESADVSAAETSGVGGGLTCTINDFGTLVVNMHAIRLRETSPTSDRFQKVIASLCSSAADPRRGFDDDDDDSDGGTNAKSIKKASLVFSLGDSPSTVIVVGSSKNFTMDSSRGCRNPTVGFTAYRWRMVLLILKATLTSSMLDN